MAVMVAMAVIAPLAWAEADLEFRPVPRALKSPALLFLIPLILENQLQGLV